MIKIAPSVLAADFNNLEEEIKIINQTNCDYIHCDIMDGHFVPNISFGQDIVKNINKISTKKLDVHLMIENVSSYINSFINSGANIITFHIEAEKEPLRIIEKIKKLNTKVGIALKPNTDIKHIFNFLEVVDLILVMTVEPGFGGQKFLESQLTKIRNIRELVEKKSLNLDIQVDGGINQITAKKCINAGANFLVAGSYIFKDLKTAYKDKIHSLR